MPMDEETRAAITRLEREVLELREILKKIKDPADKKDLTAELKKYEDQIAALKLELENQKKGGNQPAAPAPAPAPEPKPAPKRKTFAEWLSED